MKKEEFFDEIGGVLIRLNRKSELGGQRSWEK